MVRKTFDSLLAKKLNDAWMSADDAKALPLDGGGLLQGLTGMDPLYQEHLVSQRYSRAGSPTTSRVGVFVFVVSEKAEERRTATIQVDQSSEDKKGCRTSGAFPQEGDFLKLFEWTDEDCGQLKDISSIENFVGFTDSKFSFGKRRYVQGCGKTNCDCYIAKIVNHND
ncbi:hypothetical protein PI124_g5827 [Phytophthora idaei]|nr:hypothetical protein PI126_g12356 [Phytophthora idaei]KAG3249533.1 hypothetical protein PI124_g5827 [Phytophthora idaei]